jgi:hypothetical protein
MQTTRPKPVAECISCQKISIFRDKIDKNCFIRNDGERCLGFFVRKLRALDWTLCLQCNGSGTSMECLCSQCYGDGWIRGRRVRSDG